jgi:all-trans-retinol 13,14-reductase
MTRAVIIGSGISGLTAALLLRRRGYDVLVVEQQTQAGGALHRFRRQGVSFDVGFHYTGGLGEGQILRTLWRYCGIESSIPAIAFPDDAADCIRVDGLPDPVRAYFSYDRFAEELYRIFPQEKEGIAKFFQATRESSNTNPFYNMSLPLTSFLRELAFPEQVTLGDLIRSCTTDPYLQAVLSHPVYLHGVAPDNIGLAMHASVAHPVYTGMYSVDRGGQAIADAYLCKLKDAGIEVRINTQVEHILADNGKVTGIATDKGEKYPATDVIFTGHPALLPDLVTTKALRKIYCNRLREMTSTPSMFMVFGAVRDGQYDPQLQWNNYYALPNGLSIPGIESTRPEDCFFVSSCGLRDTGDDNQTSHDRAIILMRPAFWEESEAFDLGRKKRSEEYQSWKQEESRKLIASVNRKWDGLLHGFQVINTASPLTFRDELKYVRGSAYGVQHSTDQFAVGARTRLPGLWLSGQSTLMPGIMGAALSALVTVGGMVGLESLWEEIRDCT